MNQAPLSFASRILAYEENDMTPDELIEFFCDLYNTGMINHLQGHYGRTMADYVLNNQIIIAEGGKATPGDVEE